MPGEIEFPTKHHEYPLLPQSGHRVDQRYQYRWLHQSTTYVTRLGRSIVTSLLLPARTIRAWLRATAYTTLITVAPDYGVGLPLMVVAPTAGYLQFMKKLWMDIYLPALEEVCCIFFYQV